MKTTEIHFAKSHKNKILFVIILLTTTKKRNFNFFYKYQVSTFNQNLEDQSLFLCRYISFMAYFSMQTSAWILTIITVDRYLIISSNNWMQKYSKNIKFSLVVIATVVLIVALINFPVALLNGKVNHKYNASSETSTKKKVICYSNAYIMFWQRFSLLLECIFPLILMTLFNVLLVKRTYKSSTKFKSLHQNNPKSKSNVQKHGSLDGSPKESHLYPNHNITNKSSNSYIDDEHTTPTATAQATSLQKLKLSIPNIAGSFKKSSKKLNNAKADNMLAASPANNRSFKVKPTWVMPKI